MLDRFLSPHDAARAARVFEKLARHDVRSWALTGGLAIEIHRLRLACAPSVRPLNDIDFIADAFDCIPETLANGFLFRHIHPLDPPGKTMLQTIDAETAVRIDVFRALGATMSRTSRCDFAGAAVRLISLEDLLARAARLALDLADGIPTPPKHARDFLRLAELPTPAQIETAWQDQRKSKHPETFAEASALLHILIPASPHLLTAPRYSTDTGAVCPRCASTGGFRLADPKMVVSLLGYC